MQHQEFYSLPEAYDLAFSYRDVGKECDFLTAVYEELTGRLPRAVLELACGPGAHVREFYRRGLRVAALDLVPAMVDYIRERTGPGCELLVADMADFRLEQPVDLAFTLLDSLPYLTTNDKIIAHFRAVWRALTPKGVYVVELRHPRDILTPERSTVNEWTMEREGLKVTVEWGAERQVDPIDQTEHVLSRLTVQSGERVDVVESRGVLRPLLFHELRALVDLATGFRLAGAYGDLDLNQPLDDSEKSWRMVLAFQKG